MATAPGIATIISNLSTTNYRFAAYRLNSQLLGLDIVNGDWSIGSTANKIVWNGPNPTIQNTDGQDRDVVALRVGIDTGGVGQLVAVIPHTAVTLSDQSTIEYTSIEITFETEDLPA